ncbi:NADPH-dependent 1-acyldihydroxyacetone phosphate reductase [Aspergillus udagawae]|uniref:NADPH-dependent 1-acyldihydroxyacetone phosphate reductase n=1 Tax=Aspergillus udagawae TaxID=91492 RepID=A0A8H3P400_9EURO|nr:NADPH-dependent 1-acyldihydroxyacetone phosphate reductase [Aspergillus udagawae]
MTNGSVLITGCSDGGIGSALALAFQAKNYHVFATARNTSKMTGLHNLPNITLLTLDVTNPAHIATAVDTVRSHTAGSLTYLINNAGRNHFMPVLDEDLDAARRIYETNVFGPLALTKAFAPLVIKARGSMVFITSIAGYVNTPYMGVYSASKRSLEIIAETLRLEMAPFNVKVLSIVTGAVRTNGQTYFDDLRLPEDSLYKTIEDTVVARARGKDGATRMAAEEYAAQVVRAITAGRQGKFWCGSMAGTVWFGSTYLPQWIMDAGSAKGTGLDELGTDAKKD